jgi:hypothetical protein
MSSGRSLLLATALVLAAATGFAQTRGKKTGPKKGPPPPPKTPSAQTVSRPPPASAPDAGITSTEPETAPKVPTAAMSGKGEAKTAAAKEKEPSDAGVTVVDKDGGSKQFRFTETDIEGRLKAPELVYFLRRVRAEFAAGDLGHRSFLRELSETKHDPNF